MTKDVTGADLAAGQTLVEHLPGGVEQPHLIDHFDEYPGRFHAGHARVVHCADGYRCTAFDHECFHIEIGD